MVLYLKVKAQVKPFKLSFTYICIVHWGKAGKTNEAD